MSVKILRLGLFVPIIPLAVLGCGGVNLGAGEYDTFRIASTGEPSFKGNCQDDPNHKTTFDEGSTLLIYGVNDENGEELFLDTGDTVLVGAKQENGAFEFNGKDTQTDNPVQGTTITTTKTARVTFTVDGKSISGDSAEGETATCSGNCAGIDSTTCTITASFNGVEVKGADVPNP